MANTSASRASLLQGQFQFQFFLIFIFITAVIFLVLSIGPEED